MDALSGMGQLGSAEMTARAKLAVNSAEAPTVQAGEDAQEAAKRFEGLLASMLVKELRQTLPEGFFGDGAGADIYAGWLDTHLSEALVESDALGIAGMVKAELGRLQTAVDEQAGAEPSGAQEQLSGQEPPTGVVK